jgi:dTDP-4-dehydrorhamnose 3,5-epimerase
MKLTALAIADVKLIELDVFSDARGHFFESYNRGRFESALGRELHFAQDNHSHSRKGVLRGLHYQAGQPQGKLVRVLAGTVFDVAVDLRRASPTCGCWVGVTLSAETPHQLWIPEGFAHGLLVLSESAEVAYKTTTYWSPEHERCIAWDDPSLAISWPLDGRPVLSAKDAAGLPFSQAELLD